MDRVEMTRRSPSERLFASCLTHVDETDILLSDFDHGLFTARVKNLGRAL
jgi:hypothetical protein